MQTRNTAALAEMGPDLTGARLDELIEYSNHHGLSYRTSVRDILMHLHSHGAYHRGQIHHNLRQAGHEPVNTDYVTYVRELASEAWVP
jgi:uncharacterized damage-inducible protein DinB